MLEEKEEKNEEELNNDDINEEAQNNNKEEAVLDIIKKAEEISGEKITIEENKEEQTEEENKEEQTEEENQEEQEKDENEEENQEEQEKDENEEESVEQGESIEDSSSDIEKNIVENEQEETFLIKFKRIWKNDPRDFKSDKEKIIANVLSYVKIIVAAFILAVFVNNFILSNTTIPSSSMESTIMEGDRLFGFRLAYKFDKPERGDIIIFKFPDNESENYIKRVIGLPNDTVEIKEGIVYINGDKIKEEYLNETPNAENFGPYIVPDDSYFVLGDNRNKSKDSRYWENTFVHEDKIIAKAMVRYFPSIKFMD